jgi:hypothetical protein
MYAYFMFGWDILLGISSQLLEFVVHIDVCKRKEIELLIYSLIICYAI